MPTHTTQQKWLLETEELKAIEDAMMRAMVRALRVAARENLIAGYTPPPAESSPLQPKLGEHEQQSSSGQVTQRGNVSTEPEGLPRPHDSRDEGLHAKRRSMMDVCRTTEAAPPGYISAAEASALMGARSAEMMLRQWILDGQVTGIIVNDGKGYDRGLAGRLMVHRQQFITRNEARKRNAALPRFDHRRVNSGGEARH
jgi:hypothetical protein